MRQGRKVKIGELAKQTGLTQKTIRYYELYGLIEEPERAESGYRYFGPEDVERLEFIKKAKRLGLSLDEIKGIIAIHKQRQPPCVHVLDLMDQKLEQLDAVIGDLKAFRQELANLRDESQKQIEGLPEGVRFAASLSEAYTTGENWPWPGWKAGR